MSRTAWIGLWVTWAVLVFGPVFIPILAARGQILLSDIVSYVLMASVLWFAVLYISFRFVSWVRARGAAAMSRLSWIGLWVIWAVLVLGTIPSYLIERATARGQVSFRDLVGGLICAEVIFVLLYIPFSFGSWVHRRLRGPVEKNDQP